MIRINYFIGLLLCFMLWYATVQGQIIATIAGTGTAGFSGDGGAALLAKLSYPGAIAIDASGNIFFADVNNFRVRKITNTGIISTIAGIGTVGYTGDGGHATAAKLGSMSGIAIDVIGNIYVTDRSSYSSTIRRIDTFGIITTIAGSAIASYFGDGGPASSALLHAPDGIAIDAAGNIFFADASNFRVRKISASGIISTIAGNGTGGYGPDGSPATSVPLTPKCVAVDLTGNVYVATFGVSNYYIRKINSSGLISTIAGTGLPSFAGDGGPATAASISVGNGICVDAIGNIYFTDATSRIRKIDIASGIINTIAGTGTMGFSGDTCAAINAQFNSVNHVAADGIGNLYVSDGNNQRIRKIYQGSIPLFTSGASQSLNVCKDSIATLNSLLAVADGDVGQDIDWATLTAPMHGTLTAAFSDTTTGGTVTPAGLSYIPTTGYTGVDTFRVVVTDCGNAKDTTAVYVTVSTCTTGVKEMVQQGHAMSIYPNPAMGASFTVNVAAPTNEPVRLIVRNIAGEKVKEHDETTNSPIEVQLSVPRGVYFINAISASGVWSGRVVLQ